MNNQPAGRLNYLDQFRGYTVFGMIIVNFLGGFHRQIHQIFHHHNTYCSYPDTIMPQFFFAVGFALRYTMVKRLKSEGWTQAHLRIVRRVFVLFIIAAVFHGFIDDVGDNWQTITDKGLWYWIGENSSRNLFQTLTHIAVTTLWVLPVIGQRWPIRLLWLLGSAALHVWCSHEFYLKYALERPVIDGGPLGFLTWTIPVLAGSFVSDFLTQPNVKSIFAKLMIAAVVLMGLGYGLSCLKYPFTPIESAGTPRIMSIVEPKVIEIAPPPFMPPYYPRQPLATYEQRNHINDYPQYGPVSLEEIYSLWTMSQRTGSVSYLTFATGFSILVLALCYVIFGQTRQIGIFRTLGSNALVAYIVHGFVILAAVWFLHKDGPLWSVMLGLGVAMGVTWLVCYALERRGWYVRV